MQGAMCESESLKSSVAADIRSTVNVEGRYAFVRTLYQIRKKCHLKLSFLQALFLQFEFGPHLPTTLTLTGDTDIIQGLGGPLSGKNLGPWTYTGEVLLGLRHGTGACTWPKSPWALSTYEGQWHMGERQGNGKFARANGRDLCDGSWLHGEMHGYGKHTNISRSVFEGFYRGGKKVGAGKMTLKGGAFYEGNWADNKMDGLGKITRSDDGSMHVGMFRGGREFGRGKLTSANGAVHTGKFDWDEVALLPEVEETARE